jgi:diacylglycerol O-acyltransferase / wax synthase
MAGTSVTSRLEVTPGASCARARAMATRHFHYPLQLSARMLPTDALFWYVEEATPELRPLVAGLLMLDRRPDHDQLRASVERWVARLPRLRQRVVEAPLHLALPEWEEDPHFEIDYHAREVILPEPATERHLLDFVGAVFATPLDHMRPLWEAYLIEGLAGDRAACFFKVHHSVMDGVGSLAVFDAFTQAHPAEPVRVPRHIPQRPSSSDGLRLGRLLRDAASNAVAGLGAAAAVSARALFRPGEVIDELVRAVRGVRGLITDLTAPATYDPLAQASTGIGRRLDAMSLSMPRLRRIKETLGVTLNDVVLTAVSGAVGRYHVHRNVHLHELHCMVPMSLRPDDERQTLGNRVGAFNVALPVAEPDPLVRLARIQHQTGAAKSDRRGAAYPLMTRALALMPGFAYRLLAQSVTGRVNLICTNMPGPPAQRYLAGATVEAIYPFAPVALGTPLSIALMSYGDTYGIGIDTDPAAIPDPELLSQYLAAAVDEIETRVLPRPSRVESPRVKRVPPRQQRRERRDNRARVAGKRA